MSVDSSKSSKRIIQNTRKSVKEDNTNQVQEDSKEKDAGNREDDIHPLQ